MNHPAARWAARIPAIILMAVLPATTIARPASAARPASLAGLPAAGPSAADRTMPHLKFVCPPAIGDHNFAGILPDGPRQEQCFYEDKDGSSFAVGASWVTRPADPGDPYAVCAEPGKTAWYEDRPGSERDRFSPQRRAHAYIFLNLYWPNPEKLARQRALFAQSQAVGDEMLAVAEKLAQPCAPATPTPSPEPAESSDAPSEPGGPSESDSPGDSPEPSATDDEPLCGAIDGRLTDNDGEPVEGIVVRLAIGGEDPAEAVTDVEGRFRFGDIPDTPQARVPEAAQLAVLIRDGAGTWRLRAGDDDSGLLTQGFALGESGGCRHDLTTSSLDQYEGANPETVDAWADLWTVVSRTRRALAYATTTLGVTLRDVPIVIDAWCPESLSPTTCTATGTGAFASDRIPTANDRLTGLGGTGRVPYVALAPGLTSRLSERPEDDTIYHELGHILQADLAGGFSQLAVQGTANHAGYANPSSNDSWIEGFASWFAVTVRLADGRRQPYYEWYNSARLALEPDIRAWEANGLSEEWAVAGLLLDLTDSGTPQPRAGRAVPFSVTGDGLARLIEGTATGTRPGQDVVVVVLYDAAGKVVGTDEAYLFQNGRFLDVPYVSFARAVVSVQPATTPLHPDDDPFTISPRTVVQLITSPPNVGTRGGRPSGSSMVFDVSELHSVLRSTLRRPKEVDALFIAHGFFENLKNPNEYVRGAAVGMTTHTPFDPVIDPRYNTQVLPAQFVEVDTGGLDARVVVFPQNGVPYAATPDGEHRVPVMVPGSPGSRAAVVTLVDGRAPGVSVIEGATFWPEAARHDAPFLTIQPKLTLISATNDRPAGGVPVAAGLALLLGLGAGGVALGVWHRRRSKRRTAG